MTQHSVEGRRSSAGGALERLLFVAAVLGIVAVVVVGLFSLT